MASAIPFAIGPSSTWNNRPVIITRKIKSLESISNPFVNHKNRLAGQVDSLPAVVPPGRIRQPRCLSLCARFRGIPFQRSITPIPEMGRIQRIKICHCSICVRSKQTTRFSFRWTISPEPPEPNNPFPAVSSPASERSSLGEMCY